MNIATVSQDLNFARLYGTEIKKIHEQELKALADQGTVKGTWIKYRQGSSHEPLTQALEGKGTGWCIAGEEMCKKHLNAGDMYVFYTHDAQGNPIHPRAVIRMAGDKIVEVRGVAHEQNLDPVLAGSDVIQKKLKEFGSEGERYKIRDTHIKQLSSIAEKHEKKQILTREDLRFIYEVDSKIEGFGYEADPRIEKILATRDPRKDLAFALNYEEKQISLTQEEALKGGIKFHYGDLDLKHVTSAKVLILPEHVSGDINLQKLAKAQHLKLPKRVNGRLWLNDLTSAKGLILPEHIGELSLGSLTSAKDLIIPSTMKGTINLEHLTNHTGLILPNHLDGGLILNGLTSIKGLKLPEYIGGDLYLGKNINCKDLVMPKFLGGTLSIKVTDTKDLVLPDRMFGLALENVTDLNGLKLPKFLEEDLYLVRLKSANGLIIPKNMRDLHLSSLDNLDGLVIPEDTGVERIFINYDLYEEAKRKFPKFANIFTF